MQYLIVTDSLFKFILSLFLMEMSKKTGSLFEVAAAIKTLRIIFRQSSKKKYPGVISDF